MWTLNPFAPKMPAWQRLAHIEACHKLALFDCLISWAEWVESEWQQHFHRYPFADGPSGLWVILIVARETLASRTRERAADALEVWLDDDISRLANTLATARRMPERATWDASGLHELIYLNDLLKCEP